MRGRCRTINMWQFEKRAGVKFGRSKVMHLHVSFPSHCSQSLFVGVYSGRAIGACPALASASFEM